jgi:hypothetical protein
MMTLQLPRLKFAFTEETADEKNWIGVGRKKRPEKDGVRFDGVNKDP